MLSQLHSCGIRDERVLAAMDAVPRHLFVPEALRAQAYADHPVDIGAHQTISQPYMVAAMLQYAALAPGDRALEVGSGSGYLAALLARLCASVAAVERVPMLAERSRKTLADLGCANVRVETGDGTCGWPAAAPYDAIIVSAAAPTVPQPLLDQLADGGRLVIPVGDSDDQMLQLIFRQGAELSTRELFACKFVPLIGEHGFSGLG